MGEVVRRIRPTPSDAYLGNPHKGCCTFQHFNGDELYPGTSWSERGPLAFPSRVHADVTPGYLPSTVAYCRWFWRDMQPEQGRHVFDMIDGALATAEARGQTVAVRLMAYDQGNPLPDWYRAKHHVEANGQPDHDSPAYLEHWGGFVREFARRYDADPRLESIDVTYIGWWGEGDGVCSAEQCRRFATLWRDAFTRTPRLALIAGDQMRESIALGSGWRCDCYGDLSDTGSECVLKHSSWNHMYECYPSQVVEAGASESWRRAPVHLETCWVPMYWYRKGWDLDFILQQGLKYHSTYFMPKYTALPEAWMPRLAEFCRRLGYRFVLRNALIESPVERNAGTFRLRTWIENVGVAPMYHRYDLAVRLRQRDREEVIPLTDVDVRTWMPGDTWIDRAVRLPPGFKPGWVEVAVGLVQPGTAKARVRFAVKEQFADGWVSLNGMEID